MKRIFTEIIENRAVRPGYFRLRLGAGGILNDAAPGQFVMVKSSDGFEPLLRRPFGVHRVIRDGKKRYIEILYKIAGRGTCLLSRKKRGELLDVIGPLGKGFDLSIAQNCAGVILIAGGMGVAPLLELASKIKGKSAPIAVMLGAKTGRDVLCAKELKALGCEVKIATEDGSKGTKGLATGLLDKFLSETKPRSWAMFACGPKPMLKAIQALSKKYDIKTQASFEEYMACGVGACLGCPIKIVDTARRPPTSLGAGATRAANRGPRTANRSVKQDWSYKMVCKDGPVFNLDEVVW